MLDTRQKAATINEVDAVPDPRRYVARSGQLPLKLRWPLVAWLRSIDALDEAKLVIEATEAERGASGTVLEERALLAIAAGQHDAAERLLRQRIELAPSATARLGLARFLLDAGRMSEAAAISRELDASDPDLMTVAQFRVRVARATGDDVLARETLETMVERKPDNLSALTELAELALAEGDLRLAAGIIDHALDLASDEPPASLARASSTIFEALGDATRATTMRDQHRAAQERAEARLLEQRRKLATEIERIIGPGTMERSAAEGPHPPARSPTEGRGTRYEDRVDARPSDFSPQSSVLSKADPEPLPFDGAVDPEELDPRVLPVLREQFGFPSLRPGQAAVIANVLAGRDTLATMPTGAGKSLTFQLPAMLLDGVTLVLSPLIALMKDQVEGLPPVVRDRAVLVNSSLSPEEQRSAQARIAAGEVKLVYAAPERLRQASFLAALREAGVALVVIDEAHCISLWGHDFRPDYLSIPVALADFADATVLAITATATPEMADAIAAGLKRPLHRVRASVFRSNLFYEVHRLPKRDAKVAKLLDLCEREQGPGIVYASSRRDTETIAALLRGRGINAVPYHAGLERDARAENQRRFMSGGARVVIATVAFGMGVDKANVRWIIHLTPPMSAAAYAQESGRAGRDGQLAHCVLLCTTADRTSLLTLARRDEIDLETLRRVYAAIRQRAVGRWALVDLAALVPDDADDAYAERDRTRIALGVLEQAGLVTRHPDTAASRTIRLRETVSPDAASAWRRLLAWAEIKRGATVVVRTAEACEALNLTPSELDRLLADNLSAVDVRFGVRVACLELHPAPPDTRATLEALLHRSRVAARERIDEVFAYAGAGQCRHVVLAAHLGERIEPCGTVCDVCTGRAARRAAMQPTDKPARQRRETTTADARAVLDAIGTLPFPVGKTGLVRLLLGSAESSIRADRSPSFGALEEVVKARIDALVDRLIEDGYLHRDMNHEFKLITLTDRGRAANTDDLSPYDPAPSSRAPRQRSGTPSAPVREDIPLGAEDGALYEQLAAWRTVRASAEGVPPYVVATNNMLADLARHRPRTLTALAEISGFGPARVERRGAELLALINDA